MIPHASAIPVLLDDLGDWGDAQLRSEFDPEGPVIRINSRIADALSREEKDRFIAACIAHELYHYGEAAGMIPKLQTRREREAAASAW